MPILQMILIIDFIRIDTAELWMSIKPFSQWNFNQKKMIVYKLFDVKDSHIF